jgi:hypothetical protein
MAYSTIRFTVQAAKPHDEVNLNLRMAAASEVRNLYRRKIDAAVAAGATKQDACTKIGFLLQQARKASRFTRNIAPGLLQWAGMVEYHRDDAMYPQHAPMGAMELEEVRLTLTTTPVRMGISPNLETGLSRRS